MCHQGRTCLLILGLLGLILEPLGADIPPCVGGLEELVAALRAPHARQRNDAGYKIGAFINQVEAQAGSAISDADAALLIRLATSLVACSGAPILLSVTPLSGIAGDRVTLRGYYFGQPGGAGIVSFNGVKIESITFWSNQRIETSLPDTASGPAARVSRPIPLPTIEAEVDRIGLPDPGAQLNFPMRSAPFAVSSPQRAAYAVDRRQHSTEDRISPKRCVSSKERR